MFSREDDQFTKTNIWQNLDFKKVKQRLNRITNQLEEVVPKSSQVKATASIDPKDHAKLKEFMEANHLTESQAIATIVNAFFSNTPQTASNTPNLPEETLEQIAAIKQQMTQITEI
jgi:hypothetical protein